MAVISSTKDFWMHPNGLTFSINYFGNPQLIQTSLLAGAVILAYRKDVIGYNAAHNFREWKLQAFPTQLSDTCTYYVHVELSRTGNTAMVIYSPVIRDMQGRTLLSGNRVSGTYDDNVSADSWFIYIGALSASVDSDGNTVERAWTDGVYTGTLATDQYRMEEASGDWVNMFSLNSVTGLIDVLKTISKATINALTVAKEFVFGGKTLTGVAGASDTLDKSKVNDATLPTTGYTKKYVGDEIEALDDHFLIKDDPDAEQSVAGPVTFEKDVTVQGDHAVGKSQTIGGTQTVSGSQTIGGNQRIEGNTAVGGDVTIGSYTDTAGAVQGAKITKDGVGTFAGLKSKYFEIYELIYNIQTAEDGIKSFSDNGIIEEVLSVVEEASGASPHKFTHRITLKMRELRDGYLITFKPDDVIFGYVHNVGDSGSSAMGGQSWMLVRSIDNDTLTMEVMLYDQGELLDDDSITYILPTASMAITRWGNRTDTERQNTFYISTEQGNIVQLMGVTHPKIDVGNIGTVTGLLPSDLLAEVQKRFSYINPKQPYFYGRGMIVQDLMEMDYLGNPIKTERYRGAWSKEVAMSDDPYMVTPTTYDTVTHKGLLWICNVPNTTVEPSSNVTEWTKKTDSSSSAIYEIKPVPNIMYVSDGKLTNDTLTVKVGETSSDGYKELVTESELSARGLRLQYAIDGAGDRVDLNISPVGLFELEDGSGSITTEDGVPFALEGDSIDVESIKKEIVIYLVDSNGTDVATYVIPVVKDGESSYVFSASTQTIPVTIDPATNTVANDVSLSIFLFLKKGEKNIDPYLWTEDIISGGGFIEEANDDEERQCKEWVLLIPKGASISKLTPYVVNARFNDDTEVISTLTISFGRLVNGEDGESPYTIIATPPNINVLVNANDGSIISDVETAVYIYVKKGTSDIEPTMYYVDADEFETNSATQGIVKLINPIAQSGNKRWRVKIRINKGSYKQSDIPSLIRVKVFDRYATDNENNPLLIGYADVTPSISQRGLVGPAGETGPLLFPAGYLKFGESYSLVMDGDSVVAQPFYYYQTDEQKAEGIEGTYYVLQKNITAEENTSDKLSDKGYWRPFERIKYLFTEALMANWGKLASAVFWGNYQFSQYGLKDDSTKIDASAFSDEMFTNDRLNGTITPNLFLDFLSGMIKTNKLSETFKEFDYYSPREKAYVYNATSETYEEIADTPMLLCSNEIDFNSSYNIKMDSGTKSIKTTKEPITGWSNDYRLLTMPLIEDIARGGNTFVRGMDWEPDGIHASVILRPDDSWRKERYFIQNKTMWVGEYLSKYLAYGAILCADARLFDQHSYIYDSGNTQQCKFFPIDNWDAVSEYSTVEKAVQGGFFVVNGEITKFLFLEPGSMVRLRSCTSKLRYGVTESLEGTERKVTLWYVENADEFAEIPVYVRFNGKFYMKNGEFVKHSYEHTYGKATFGAGINYTNRVFGSKIFKTVIDKIQAAGAYAEPVVNITARTDKVTEKWEDSIVQITWQ